jgi:hypothetical protein
MCEEEGPGSESPDRISRYTDVDSWSQCYKIASRSITHFRDLAFSKTSLKGSTSECSYFLKKINAYWQLTICNFPKKHPSGIRTRSLYSYGGCDDHYVHHATRAFFISLTYFVRMINCLPWFLVKIQNILRLFKLFHLGRYMRRHPPVKQCTSQVSSIGDRC